MHIKETTPKPDTAILPGFDFADAWRATGVALGQDAQSIAGRIGGSTPRWTQVLLWIRNRLVKPFGLKTGESMSRPVFPVLSTRPDRVVMGMDDKHLDFRLVVEVAATSPSDIAATATTYVRTHNRLGRLYLQAIMPFHRIIVPTMLRRAMAVK